MNTFKMDTRGETRPNSGVMLPVVELVIAIGLFTIISIFIVKFFTSANTMSRQADDLSKGLIKAESAIELLKAMSPEEAAKELGVQFDESKNEIRTYYDKDWKVTDIKGNTKYVLVVNFTDSPEINGVLREIKANLLTDDGNGEYTSITDLTGAKYIKGGK